MLEHRELDAVLDTQLAHLEAPQEVQNPWNAVAQASGFQELQSEQFKALKRLTTQR